VNQYLRELTGEPVTAKDFRTWGGTVVAAAALAITDPPTSDRDADRKVIAAYDVAAARLGNTRTVCRNCYVHPAVPEAYRDGSLEEHWRRTRDGKRLARPERLVQRVLADKAA
jgi:DNA topoisomerase-1